LVAGPIGDAVVLSVDTMIAVMSLVASLFASLFFLFSLLGWNGAATPSSDACANWCFSQSIMNRTT